MDNLNDTQLKKHLKTLSADERLLQEGDMANTTYMVMEGMLLLFQKSRNSERLIGMATTGELVGEQAVINGTPQRRTYSAQASTACTLLEFDPESWKSMQVKMPDLQHKLAKMLSARLNRANELIGILQTKGDAERLVQFIVHCAHHFGKKAGEGIEIAINAENMTSLLALEPDSAPSALKALAEAKILVPKGPIHILHDEAALVGFVTQMREQIAA